MSTKIIKRNWMQIVACMILIFTFAFFIIYLPRETPSGSNTLTLDTSGIIVATMPFLELQVSHADGFKTISGNSIQETQQKIIELLRLDYKTFVNSAFLRQGHSDEFSIKRPSERKEILANILNLHQYDELERLAKDYANQRRNDSGQTTTSIEEIDSQLAREGDYETSIVETQEILKQTEQQKSEAESNISSLRLQNETLNITKNKKFINMVALTAARNSPQFPRFCLPALKAINENGSEIITRSDQRGHPPKRIPSTTIT